MTIQDIIKEIFESEEMKKYLCEHAESLYKFQIQEMIAGSPMITIRRKREMLELLAESEDLDKELVEAEDENEREFIIRNSYAEIVKKPSEALNMLYDTTKPAVFLVKTVVCWGDEDDEYKEEETLPFTSYEKAVRYMKKWEEEYSGNNRQWFDVEKWEQDENGNLEQKWVYVVVNGQVIYCYHSELHDYECAPNKNVNLPIPFKTGDIVEVHDLPFTRKRHTLILDIGDNEDCCSVQHLYIDDDSHICMRAFKHGHIFNKCWWATSPLYRTKTFHGILEGEEEVFYIFKDYLEKRLELCGWEYLWNVFCYLEHNKTNVRDITVEFLDNIGENIKRTGWSWEEQLRSK